MAQVHKPPFSIVQLIDGFYDLVDATTGVYKACSSISLIQGEGRVILVDTGCPSMQELLISRLHDNRLTPSDVTHVICTHGHIDHIGNLNLFADAEVFLDRDIAQKGFYRSLQQQHDELCLAPGVIVKRYSGHTSADLVVVVRDVVEFGTVVMAGDLFESADDLKDASLWQSNSWDTEKQRASREDILSYANWIVPGHGKMFKVSVHKLIFS